MGTELAKNIYFKPDGQLQHPDIFNLKLSLSRNLVFKENNETEPALINRLSSSAIKASNTLLGFLNRFKNKSIYVPSLMAEYCENDLLDTIRYLIKINFLIPCHLNEDLEWLKQKIDMNLIKQFETKHFLTLYSSGADYLIRAFSDFMEDVFHSLSLKYLPPKINQKIIIYICEDREEFQGFWGLSPLPDWPKAFVYSSNILIIDQQKIMQINPKNNGSVQGMAHELVHIFLRHIVFSLPVWLEEGLCEYFSKPNENTTFYSICRQKKVYGFKEIELFARSSLLDMDDSHVRENICYRQSHSFVAYLMSIKGENYFMDCIKSIGLDRIFESAFKEYYERSVDDVEQEWQNKYLQIQVARLKTSKNFRIIKTSHNVLLYNAFYGQSLIASPDIMVLIECLKKNITISEISAEYDLKDLDSIISKLYDKQLIVFEHDQENNRARYNYDQKQIKNGILVNKLRLNMSNNCNMACSYCYGDSNQKEQINWSIAKKTLTSFFDLQEQSDHKYVQIRFFGGEPLFNWKVMEQVFEYINFIKKNIKVDYILNTNGTIVTKKIALVLASNKVNVSVSLDGLGKVNDKFRMFKSGKGTFLKVDKNIDVLLSFGCKVSISTTIGNHNYNKLKELITYTKDKENKFDSKISLSLQNMCMDSKHDLDTVSIEEKVETIMDAIIFANKINVNIGTGMIMFPFNAMLGLKPISAYCNAVAGEEVCVYPNGDIYPCGMLKIKMGNINNFNATFRTKEYLDLVKRVAGNIPACKGCDIEAFCAGGCAADAFSGKGDIFLPANNCKFEQLFFKELIKNYLNKDHELELTSCKGGDTNGLIKDNL